MDLAPVSFGHLRRGHLRPAGVAIAYHQEKGAKNYYRVQAGAFPDIFVPILARGDIRKGLCYPSSGQAH